jgi:formylglycine-generating enzyme required for sulfatase activity
VKAEQIPVVWRAYQRVPFRAGYTRELAELLVWLDGVHTSEFLETSEVYRPHRRIHEKTGINLICIPAGPFLYGSSDEDRQAYDAEKPQRRIELRQYWIGRAPVTNAQYKRFLDANPEQDVPFANADWAKRYNWDRQRRVSPGDKADHPVVLVSWRDAQAYCERAGLRMPSEEEWEKGARGTAGRIWPWGNNPPTADLCNFNGNVGTTTPVGKYSPHGDSPYGCVDMAGNVWEWVGDGRAVHGGSWYYLLRDARVSARYDYGPNLRNGNIGFRLVAPVLSEF